MHEHCSSSVLQCVELGNALKIHDRIISDFYAGRPHIHTPAFLIGHSTLRLVSVCYT